MSTGNEWTLGMQEISGSKVDITPKLSRNGKRLWSSAQKRLIVSEANKLGLSVSQISRRYDINANLIFRWMKKAEMAGGQKSALVPVGILGLATARASNEAKRPSEPSLLSAWPVRESLSGHAPTVAPALIEVELHSGTRIKIDGSVKGAAL